MLYHSLLIIHLLGFMLMAGVTLAECLLFIPLRRHPAKAKAVLPVINVLSLALPIGGPLLVLSGAGLLWMTGGAYIHQLWMMLKLALVVLLVINGFTNGFARERKLKANINAHTLRGMQWFYLSQLCIFLTIVVLAVCKFG